MLDLAVRILLFPVLVAQAAEVRRSALRLADPAGRRHGVSGQGGLIGHCANLFPIAAFVDLSRWILSPMFHK